MFRCKVSSGEFQIIVSGNSLKEAADNAIRIHDREKENSSLGNWTLVEEVDKNDFLTGNHLFFPTKQLIETNSSDGYGPDEGQYFSNEGN